MTAVENNGRSTLGGVTGAGFTPGVSGNPGGRPKGLARKVRELIGDDGRLVAQFMHQLMLDTDARNADRIEAAKWLADRGFGRSVLPVDLELELDRGLDISKMSTADLKLMLEILDRTESELTAVAQETGAIPFRRPELQKRRSNTQVVGPDSIRP